MSRLSGELDEQSYQKNADRVRDLSGSLDRSRWMFGVDHQQEKRTDGGMAAHVH